VTPQGDAHIAWLLSEVKPRIEAAFRVRTGPDSTAIGGSSLGAAISLHAATLHPDVFGLVLAESLPIRSGDAKAWEAMISGVKTWPRKIYLGGGGAEVSEAADAKAYVEALRLLDKKLDAAGLGPDRRLLVVTPDAKHDELAWSARLPGALSFLFPPPMDSTK
jgi:predicted alpha/beta superfamily hydrolase